MLKRRTACTLFIFMLLSGIIWPFRVKAGIVDEVIYIKADGSIDPVTSPIFTPDNITYTLTGNITTNTDCLVVERDNIVIDGAGYILTGIYNGGNGVRFTDASNVTMRNIVTRDFFVGIYVDSSSFNNVLSGNNVIGSHHDGICLFGFNNTLSGNNVTANQQYGILLYYSLNSILSGNNITNSECGILLSTSSNDILSGNNITNSEYGIRLYLSSNNTVSDNNLSNNGFGVYLEDSSDNVLYHNNFVGNTEQANATNAGSLSSWDAGYPSGGNFWSDYNGTDVNHDGIGDTPYIIDANNTDHYPLMVQYAIPEFPSFLVMPLFMIATLLAIVIYKRRRLT